ncbi:MAG: nuclear transport factor 2 family protein [Burkholderiales bacterium]|nr:nuclear transport factor 2 family protein [Opitutaceae bacterium]
MDLSLIYPVDPTQLPVELAGVAWPPREDVVPARRESRAPVDYERCAREWLAAWNAHDLDEIVAHYADAVEFRSPFVAKLLGRADGTIRGRAELRDYFARGLAAYPALKFEFIRLYTGVNSCVLEYRSVNNLRAAETMEFDATGKISRVVAHYVTE